VGQEGVVGQPEGVAEQRASAKRSGATPRESGLYERLERSPRSHRASRVNLPAGRKRSATACCAWTERGTCPAEARTGARSGDATRASPKLIPRSMYK